MAKEEAQKEDWFVYCDRCAERIIDMFETIDEDGLVYCKDCYQKLLERE